MSDELNVPGELKNETQEVPPQYIQDAQDEASLTSVFLSEYDETPIKELCAKTSWVSSSDVVIHCHERVGGVGTITLPKETQTSN
jgi:hypothetical protein